MARHFILRIEDAQFSFVRNTESISQESALDGMYVVRTSLAGKRLNDDDTVRSYKCLSNVKRVSLTEHRIPFIFRLSLNKLVHGLGELHFRKYSPHDLIPVEVVFGAAIGDMINKAIFLHLPFGFHRGTTFATSHFATESKPF